MGEALPQLGQLMTDLESLLSKLVKQYKYFDVHVVSENGVIKVKVHYNDGMYDVRSLGGGGHNHS